MRADIGLSIRAEQSLGAGAARDAFGRAPPALRRSGGRPAGTTRLRAAWPHAPLYAIASDLTPPINLSERRFPTVDRRAISHRWLLAVVILGAASFTLLWGALRVSLGGPEPLAPLVAAGTEATRPVTEANGRGDRLAPLPTAPDRRDVQVRLEHVRSIEDDVKPFTYLVAHLGRDAKTAGAEPPLPPARPAALRTDEPEAGDEQGSAGDGSDTAFPRFVVQARATSGGEPGPLGTPLNVTTVASSPRHLPPADQIIVLQQGDNLAHVLTLLGLSSEAAAEAVTALMPPMGWVPLVGGEILALRADPNAPSGRVPVSVQLTRTDGSMTQAAMSDFGHFFAVTKPIARQSHGEDGSADPDQGTPTPMPEHGSVKDSLEALAHFHAGTQPLVDQLMRLSASDVDLGTSVSPDDTVAMLYSTSGDERGGDPVLDFASLTIDGEPRRFYRFNAPDDGSTDYYDRDGRSITHFLLRKPVANGRLGDGFGWRIHPVLHDRRLHQGVDYAAPFGSPIVAAGAGVVEKIDTETGYGRYIRIRHDLGYETTYAHDSSFPQSIRVGTRVQQGETIAYVGSTGYSTGPHLYYEVRINGRNVDPLSIKLAAGRILQGTMLDTFKRRRDRLDVLIKASAAEVGG